MGGREVREARILGFESSGHASSLRSFRATPGGSNNKKPRGPPVLPAAPCESRRSLATRLQDGSSPRRPCRLQAKLNDRPSRSRPGPCAFWPVVERPSQISQGGWEDGRSARREFWVSSRAATPRACAVSVRRRAARTTKNLADLPSSLLLPVNLAGPSPHAYRTEAARGVPLGATERCHVSFCKRAAVRQPVSRARVGRRYGFAVVPSTAGDGTKLRWPSAPLARQP
jgi:hypothetical protein